jgi:hypothetical protein
MQSAFPAVFVFVLVVGGDDDEKLSLYLSYIFDEVSNQEGALSSWRRRLEGGRRTKSSCHIPTAKHMDLF